MQVNPSFKITEKSWISRFRNEPLHTNSFYLMASSATMAVLGFGFWTIVAHTYSAEDVGIATAFFSLAALLANLSSYGLSIGTMHYLPQRKNKNSLTNSIIGCVFIVSIGICFLNMIGLRFVAWNLYQILISSWYYGFTFGVLVVFSSLSNIFEGIFSAYRSAQYTLLKNAWLSMVKLGLPILLVGEMAWGIVTSWNIALVSAVLLSFWVLQKKLHFEWRLKIVWSDMKTVGNFTLWSHLIYFLTTLPALGLPILLSNRTTTDTIAYFYVDMMIANTIYIIPQAISQSLLVEGSYQISILTAKTKKALRLLTWLLWPAMGLILISGKMILAVIGKGYDAHGITLLQILVVSAIPFSLYTICMSILTIYTRMKQLLAINLVIILIISGSVLGSQTMSLERVGQGWFLGYSVAAGLSMISVWRYLRKKGTVQRTIVAPAIAE